MTTTPLEVKVWGEFACFTRPEMKVERVTYPVMTPSAARGLLEAIFWKPEFQWQVREIWLLNPIRYFSLVRNEVNSRASDRTASRWAEHGGSYFVEDDRAQRHTLALRDVAYLIRAHTDLKPHADADEAKYRDIFRRRVARGQCFHRPYLGCREFAANFAEPDGTERPLDLSMELGNVLFDLRYSEDDGGPHIPIFFSANIESGVLHVPSELYEQV